MDLTRLGPRPGARVVVTGGAGGIGRAVVKGLLSHGAEVAVIDLPASLESHPPPPAVRPFPADMRQKDQVFQAFSGIAGHFPLVDGLVLAQGYTAGLTHAGEQTDDQHRDLMDGNLEASRWAIQAALPLLRKADSPSIVTLSTGLALTPQPGYSSYAMAKAALVALTRAVAREEAPKIRANLVAPGGIDTAFIRGGLGRGGREDGPPARISIEAYEKLVPLGRIGVAEDVAGPVLFLLGDAARYITGQMIHVNGGALMPSL